MRTSNAAPVRKTVAALVALMLLTGCEPTADTPPPQQPRADGLPQRNPATKPATPAPVAADPIPSQDKREVYVRVACAPLDDYVSIDLKMGPYDDSVREKRCGSGYEKTRTLTRNMMVSLSANWTEASYKAQQKKNTTGSILLLIKVNGNIMCDESTPLSGRTQSVRCIPFAV